VIAGLAVAISPMGAVHGGIAPEVDRDQPRLEVAHPVADASNTGAATEGDSREANRTVKPRHLSRCQKLIAR
jgi:hypothetical protein